MKHSTQLKHHFQDKHFWLDFGLVLLLWILVQFLPKESSLLLGAYFKPILKLVAVIATLELITFFIFHLLPKKEHGFILQGFLGGLISSTAFFVHVSRASEQTGHANHYSLALIAALLSMLVECIVIIISLAPQNHYDVTLPILVQVLIFSLSLLLLNNRTGQEDNTLTNVQIIDDPVVWKKVMKLTIFIAVLTYTIHLLPEKFNMNPGLTIFVTSMFEAHSVLAATLFSGVKESSLLFSVLLVLSGHTISKIMIIWRAKNKHITPKVSFLILFALLCSWISYWIQSLLQ